ncbi:zinc finger protein 808-like isoform X3 [Homalodisca vitripennis]|uniref:zinc finger protein 808-like isoform X3 n=1 Tax=Homalodisca vitripennis TaxID=197043 RepID=UPI001EEC926F|nr:zinc finger protein 808-like isoform X3 [Homalodisca vitripennis]
MSSEKPRCRLCMHHKPYLATLFRRSLSMKVMELADVQVMENDGLPTVVCIDCENAVEKCYSFRTQIQWADKKFREEMSVSLVEVEECSIKEEHGDFMEDDSDLHSDRGHNDDAAKGTGDKGQDGPVIPLNHVEVMETIETGNQVQMIDDPQGQAEPLIEAPFAAKEEERAMDPLICTKEEDVSMESDTNSATSAPASTSDFPVFKGRPLKKRLTHIRGAGLRKNLKKESEFTVALSKKSPTLNSVNKRKRMSNKFLRKSQINCKILEDDESSNKPVVAKSIKNKDAISLNTKQNKKYLQALQSDISDLVSSEDNTLKKNVSLLSTLDEENLDSVVNKADLFFPIKCECCNTVFSSEDELTDHVQYKKCSKLESCNAVLEKTYGCLICKKEFHSPQSLQLHNKIVHTVAISIECKVCQEVFQTDKLLLSHKNRCHSVKEKLLEKSDFLCPKCGLVVKSRASLHRHNKRFHVDLPARVMCDICGKVFKSTGHLTSHKNFMHPTETDKVTCHICSKEFVCQVRFKKHMRTTHCKTRKYICEICQMTFKDKKTLDVHRTTHSLESPFKCDVCDKAFRTKYKLKTHLTSHSGEQFKCTACYRIFLSDTNLKIHIEKSHNNDVRSFHCEICDKDISTRSQYELHMKFHSDPEVQLYVCDLCGKCFESQIKCQRHRLYHDIDNKELHCSICNKTFKNNKILKNHIFLHSSDAVLYKCDICDKTFRHSSAFSSHQRVHSDESYFDCNLCNEKFKWKQTYDRHVQKCRVAKDSDKKIDQDSIRNINSEMIEESLQSGSLTWCFDSS